jgi:hypothetical protein
MDTRKTTLIATIAVIALLAVGIGFAYTAYTENSGNSTDTSYVTLTQTGATGYKFANKVDVQMDTYNDTNINTVYYRLNGSQNLTDGTNTYTLKTLGTITLHAVMTGGNTHPNLNIEISGSSNFDATANWFYIIGSAPVNGEIDVYAIKNTSKATSSWTDGPDALTMTYSTSYDDKVLNVYYGYNATNVVTKAGLDYMAVSEMPKNLEGASLIFVASNDTMDKIVYHANNNDSPLQEYTVSNPRNDTRTYTLTTSDLGFTAPAGKVFKGWSLTTNGAIVTKVTFTTNDPIDVYAIYETS